MIVEEDAEFTDIFVLIKDVLFRNNITVTTIHSIRGRPKATVQEMKVSNKSVFKP